MPKQKLIQIPEDYLTDVRYCNKSQLAKMFGKNISTISDWVADDAPVIQRGQLKNSKNFIFFIPAVIDWRISKVLEDKIPTKIKRPPTPHEQLEISRNTLVQLEISQRRRELIKSDHVESILIKLVTTLKARLLNIPAKLAPSVSMTTDKIQIQSDIELEITEALSELTTIDMKSLFENDTEIITTE